MSYYEEVEGKKITDLTENPEFRKDLITFFTSDRYGYSREDIEELGVDGLTNDFIEHMRWQDTNEVTLAKDLWFKQTAEESGDDDALDSFGRLMMAWDRSEGGGTGFVYGAGDYLRSIVQSPSTLATLATAGVGGPVSKALGSSAKKAGSAALRKSLMDRFLKQTATGVVKDQAAVAAAQGSLKAAATVGALRGAAIEGGIAGSATYGQEKLREDTFEGYEKNMGNVILSASLAGVVGGGVAGYKNLKSVARQNQALDSFASIALAEKKSEIASLKIAQDRLSQAAKAQKGMPESKQYSVLKGRITSLINLQKLKEEKATGRTLKALDPKKVQEGEDLAKVVFEGPNDEIVTPQFTSGTFKKVAAATLDLADELKFKLDDNVRITEKVAEALRKGEVDLPSIREKYGLTKQEFSLIFLSDMSEAGKTLNVGSQMSKAFDRKASAEAEKEFSSLFKGFLEDINLFSKAGITNPADNALMDLGDAVIEQSRKSLGQKVASGTLKTAKEVDRFRIGMMTTQLGTTAANAGFSLFNTALDVPNRVFYNMMSLRNPADGALDLMRGLSWGREEARLTRMVGYLDADEDLYRIFHDISRIEDEFNSNTILNKVVRGLNFANAATDAKFKEAVFYSSLQRQIRDANDPQLGRNLMEYLANRAEKGLKGLPEGMVRKAEEDALSFTFQKGYEGAEDWFGKGANQILRLHRKLPFVVSSTLPFPRFTANMIEFQHRYMPTGLAQGVWNKLTDGGTNMMVDSNEKIAKGMTGLMLLSGAVFMRLNAEEGTKYNEAIDPETGEVYDLTRLFGPVIPHMYLGDLIAREIKGEPIFDGPGEVASEMLDIVTGLELFGYGDSTITSILKSYEEGQPTEALSKILGDVAATFTMPAATFRDIQGQISVESAAVPYTREIEPESPSVGTNQTVQRGIRFLPDYEFLQIASSFNGKTDVPLYSPFDGPQPIRKYNPLLGQMTGITMKPKKTELRQEMDRLKILDYKVYGSRKVRNPNTDVAVRRHLAKTLDKEFKSWRDNRVFEAGLKYEDLTEFQKKEKLENYLKERISVRSQEAEMAWEKFSKESPRSAVGWIFNNYELKSDQYRIKGEGLDRVIFAGTGGEYKTEDEFFSEVIDDPVELANRKTLVLDWAETLQGYEYE